jgi:hypothetical protein
MGQSKYTLTLICYVARRVGVGKGGKLTTLLPLCFDALRRKAGEKNEKVFERLEIASSFRSPD